MPFARIGLIRFVFVTSGLMLVSSSVNLPIAAIVAIDRDFPPLVKYRTAIERYAIASAYAVVLAVPTFLFTGKLLKDLEQEEAERTQRELLAEANRQQALNRGFIAEQCCDCKYFAGFSSRIRCAVNPKGNPNECSEWRGLS